MSQPGDSNPFRPGNLPPSSPGPVPEQPPRIPGADPGSPIAARIAWAAAILFVLVVAILQQSGSVLSKTTTPAPTQAAAPAEIPAASKSEVLVPSKIIVKLEPMVPDPAFREKLLETIEQKPAGSEIKSPFSQADQLRIAIIAGELAGAEKATERLTALRAELPADSPLLPDLDALSSLYSSQELTPEQWQALKDHHGFFADVALAYGKPDTDPARAALFAGSETLAVIAVSAVLIAGLALLAGLILLILALVLYLGGSLRPRFVRPVPGGSLGIELVAVFVGAFILLKLCVSLAAMALGEQHAITISLFAQWALVAVLAWPLVRGVPWKDAAGPLGLTRGEGVLAEILAGILGYLACLPLYIGGVLLTLLLIALQAAITGQEPRPPENPAAEFVASQSHSWIIIVFALLATVWAPLMEESIFRGGLYRQLRGRANVFLSSLVVALAFGLMHGYPLVLLPAICALGFGFCLLREWRGSLIAPMTAHFLHNASVTAITVSVSRIVGL